MRSRVDRRLLHWRRSSLISSHLGSLYQKEWCRIVLLSTKWRRTIKAFWILNFESPSCPLPFLFLQQLSVGVIRTVHYNDTTAIAIAIAIASASRNRKRWDTTAVNQPSTSQITKMHTVWVRLNAVVFFGLSALLGFSVLAAVSKIGHANRHVPREYISQWVA